MASIKFKVKTPEFVFEPGRVRDTVTHELLTTTQGAVFAVHEDVVPRTPQAFNFLRASIGQEAVPYFNETPWRVQGVVGTVSPYAKPVEEGARPHWIPIEPLKLWAKRKGLGEGFAYYVQWLHAPLSYSVKTRKKTGAGKRLKAHWMFRESFKAMKGKVVSMFEAMQDRILEKLK